MISVVEHIEYLMSRHDCVIVPGWGAFIAQYKSAYCDSEGRWHKPERQISFNAELEYNDGLLVGSVMRRERCSFDTAVDIVRSNVVTYHRQLSEDDELSFGKIGMFRCQNGKVVFTPYQKATENYEFYGMESFLMRSLGSIEKDYGNSASGSWNFSINKNYLKIAASIAVLLVLSFVLSTPMSVDRNGSENYASLGSIELSDVGALPMMSEVRELAITMPPADNDSVVVKAYPSSKTTDRHVASGDKYYLIVCSVLSQAEADSFISSQVGKDYDFEVLPKKGKYRVYVATGKSVKDLMKLKYEIADDYPDAWVHYNR